MVEVFIGGWGNTKSVIRYNKEKPEVAECGTPDILSGNEYRGFWIRVTDGVCEFNIIKLSQLNRVMYIIYNESNFAFLFRL